MTNSSGESTRAGGDPVKQHAEKFVTFPLAGDLFDAGEKAEGLAKLFRLLSTALTEHKVSYGQGTLQFVLDAETAQGIADHARTLGLNVNVRDA
jgi:hypothetical protein